MPFLIAAGLGALLGAFNGIFTSRLTVPTLIITLGTANVFNGVMQGALKSVQINTIPRVHALLRIRVPLPSPATRAPACSPPCPCPS